MNELTYTTKEVTAKDQDGTFETSCNYQFIIESGLDEWIKTLANAKLVVIIQSKLRDIAKSDMTDQQKHDAIDKLEQTPPANLIGGSVGFTRNDIDGIMQGNFPARLPSPETLIDLFSDKTIASKAEFLEVRKAVNAERKRRKKEAKK